MSSILNENKRQRFKVAKEKNSIFKFKRFKFCFALLSFIFLNFALMPSLSVYASGFVGGGETGSGETNKQIVENVSDTNIEARFKEYVSWYSTKDQEGYSELGDPGQYAVVVDGTPYSLLLDANGDGRFYGYTYEDRQKNGKYNNMIEEYKGYFIYYVKVGLANESLDVMYSQRTYYKYYELKKEVRGMNNTNLKLENQKLGIWLYYASNMQKDARREKVDIQMVDVFEGLPCDITNEYMETMFYWPTSSSTNSQEHIGMANGAKTLQIDEASIAKNVKLIEGHNPWNYAYIESSGNFGLAFLQVENLRTNAHMNGGAYLSENKGATLLYDLTNETKLASEIAQALYMNGQNYKKFLDQVKIYAKSGEEAPYYSVGLKHLIYNGSSLVKATSENASTYRSVQGSYEPVYFLTTRVKNDDGVIETINFSTMFSYNASPSLIGTQSWHQASPGGFANDKELNMQQYINLRGNPLGSSDRKHFNGKYGGVNVDWVDATNDGKDLSKTPRGALRTLMVAFRSIPTCFEVCLNMTKNSDYKNGYGLCTSEVLDSLTIKTWNEIATSNPQMALDILTTIFAGCQDKVIFHDYASQGMGATISMECGTQGHYTNWYTSCITTEVIPPQANKINLSEDVSELLVVDLFKAFKLTNTQKNTIVEAFKNDGNLNNIDRASFNSEQLKMIESILKNDISDFTKIVLTNEQIERGLVDTSDPTSEVYCEYVPYVAVYTKKYKSNLENFKIQNSNLKIEPYNGSNMGTIVDKFVELAKKEPMNFKVLSSTSGVSLFEEGWGERGCGGVPVKRLN